MAQIPRHRPLQHQNRLQSPGNPLSLPPGAQKHAQRRAYELATSRLEHGDGLRSHPESDKMKKPLCFQDEDFNCTHPTGVFDGGGPEYHCIFCQKGYPSREAWESERLSIKMTPTTKFWIEKRLK